MVVSLVNGKKLSSRVTAAGNAECGSDTCQMTANPVFVGIDDKRKRRREEEISADEAMMRMNKEFCR